MVRKFTCYIVFVTLIWSAYTDDDKKIPDIMFKSDMTKKDFSNLLSSLIKLNEKRVNVLQKLYRLEDYGALSEVLRSGDDKNANPSNLFLIVLSKNPTDSLRRKNNFQVTSLEVAGRKKIPKLDYILDPSSFINLNVRKDNAPTESIFANAPRDFKPKIKILLDNRNIKNTTTTTLPPHRKLQKRKHDNKIFKITHKAKVLRKGNGKQDIRNNNKSPDTTKIVVYTSTLGYKENVTHYPTKTEVILTNNKLKQKLKTIKDTLFSKRNKSRNYIKGKVEKDKVLGSRDEDIENNRSKSTTTINGDFPTKKRFGNHHVKLDANKLVSEISNKIIDQIYHLKHESNKNVSRENDNSINMLNFNDYPKRKTNKSSSTHPKLKYNSNFFKLGNENETDRNATALKNDPKINVTVDSDKANESNHSVFNMSSINDISLSINKDFADADYDFMINDKRKNITEVLAPLKFPERTLNNKDNNIESSNKDETETNIVVRNAAKHSDIKPMKVNDYDNEETINGGEKNNEVFTIIVTDERKDKAENNQPKGLELAKNEFDQSEAKPVARAFKKCLNKKARKLCIKSCNSAYRNVCRRLSCTTRSKKALKKECKKSCNKIFDSGKYSGDESDCDDSSDSDSS